MTQPQQQPFAPGMEFRQFDMVGTCRVMEEAPNGDVAFRTPDGAIEKISAKTLHRRLYVSKDFILEPAIVQQVQLETLRRVWIKSEKVMVYHPTGVVRVGYGWHTNHPEDVKSRLYKLFFPEEEKGLTYLANDLVFMDCTGMVESKGLSLFAYDVSETTTAEAGKQVSIVVPSGRNFMIVDYTGKKQLLTNPGALNKVGNIFENPDYYDIFVKSQHIVNS